MRTQGYTFTQSRKQHPVEPDSPMPSGFFRRLHARTLGRGEKRLAAAVLEDAVHTFQRTRGSKDYHSRVLYWEAETWFGSGDRRSLFSFENVCSILGLRSIDIRRLLQRWIERRTDGFPLPKWMLGEAPGPGMRLASTGPAGLFPVPPQASLPVTVKNERAAPISLGTPGVHRDGAN